VKSRRLAVVGLAVLASAALAVSGCGTKVDNAGGGAVSAASPTPKDPKEAVLASTKTLTQQPYKFTISSDGLTGTGVADPAAKKTSMSAKGSQDGVNISIEFVLIGSDLWLKMDLGKDNKALGIPSQYMHIDQSKLKDKAAFGFKAGENDPAESDKLVKGVVDAKRVDDRHYTITLDLTKTSSSSVNEKVLSKLGDKAKAVPGTVTLDDQGRLSEITVDLSAVDPAATVKVTYSDYGTPVTINAPPKSQTIEAPASVYGMFNS
jgi:hypothetical protein